jgi:hypothetical protein
VELAGPFAVAVLLLAAGGLAKMARPAPATAAVRSLGVPLPASAVRLGGLAEAALAIIALVSGARLPAAAVALCYLIFAGVVALARFGPGRLASCGCFGTEDAPPTVLHLALDLVFAGIAGAVSLSPLGRLATFMGGQPLLGIPFSGFVLLAAWFSYLAHRLPIAVVSQDRQVGSYL